MASYEWGYDHTGRDIKKDGSDYWFSIEWREVEHSPCDPEMIKCIKTDGTIWLIVDDDSKVYCSTDREHWHSAHLGTTKDLPRITNLDFIGGIWIAMAGYKEGFYYSHDAQNWKKTPYPEGLDWEFTQTENIIRFNGLWLWRFKEDTEYSYVEEGIIFDSDKTSTYNKVSIFCTEDLEGPWRRWEGTPSFSEGIEVECIQTLPDGNLLLAFCKYDRLYISHKKKNSTKSFVSYFIPGKSWRTCTWSSEDDSYDTPLITRMGPKMMCFYSDRVMTSDKGFEWNLQSKDIRIEACFHSRDVSLFTKRWGGEVFYVSQTGEMFAELVFEKGDWEHFAANEQGALSVYSPNRHESFLRSGNYIFQPKS